MNKILCIYPKDTTTEFLRPVYDAVCAKPHVVGLELDTIEDDDFLEKLSNHLKDAGIVFFLGHGSSTCLYGTNLNPLIEDKMENIEDLRNKSLILFACRSTEFIKNYHFQDSLGFGFIPTSLDDARDGVLHGVNLRNIDSSARKKYFISTMLRYSPDFKNSYYYKSFRSVEISEYKAKMKTGKVKVRGDFYVLCGQILCPAGQNQSG